MRSFDFAQDDIDAECAEFGSYNVDTSLSLSVNF
jgi:hypothetical protein